MGKQRRRFTREFKVEAVRLALLGEKPQKAVAAELGIKPEAMYRWVKEFRGDPSQSFPGQGLMKDRDREVEQLRRENARLQAENAFLKKVSAFFAKGQR